MDNRCTLRFGPYLFDPEQRFLSCDGQLVPASPKVLETLELLLAGGGRLISKQEFMAALWPDTFVEEGNLTQNIFVLRKLLGTTAAGKPYIETVARRGYRMSVPVQAMPMHDGELAHGVPHAATITPAWSRVANGTSAQGRTDGFVPDVSEQTLLHSSHEFLSAAALDPPRQELFAASLMPQPVSAQGRANNAAHASSFSKLMIPASLLLCSVALAFFFGSMQRPKRSTYLAVMATRRLTDDGMPKNLGPFPSTLVSDGSHLYFTEKRDNRSVLAKVSVAGGEVESVPAPFPDATVVAYSARNQHLLIGSVWHTRDDRPIMAQQLSGGVAKQLGELTGHDASWSPDGQHVAFANGRFLYIANADGSDVRRIVTGDGVVFWPRWSPDGRLLRFSENLGSNEERLWEIAATGKQLRRFYPDRTDADQLCCGDWTADGRYFYYMKMGPASDSLWVVPAEPSWLPLRPANPMQLTTGPVDFWRSPLPSGDNRHLWAIGSHLRGELDRVDPGTRQPRPYLGGISAEGVSFSPDGTWIAYTAYPDGTLWRSRLDGREKKQLTNPPLVARFPRWSPDGNTLVFLAGTAGSQWRLYLASAESGAVHPLLEDDGSQGVASWSPDGKSIAFGRLLDYGMERNPNLTIQIYDLHAHTRTTLHDSQGLWTARWSPDGRFFTAVTEDNRVLRLYDVAAQRWTDLAQLGVNDVVWSPDSRFVYFDTLYGNEPMLYRIRLADHKLEPWADLRGLHRGGFFSPWLGMSPDGAPLLLRDTAIEEVYEMTVDLPR